MKITSENNEEETEAYRRKAYVASACLQAISAYQLKTLKKEEKII